LETMGVLPDKLIQCPGCGKPLRFSLVSYGDAKGMRRWVDGYIQHPLLVESPQFCGCPECGRNFWVEDAKTMGSFSFLAGKSIPRNWESASYVKDLGLSELLQVLPDSGLQRKPVGFEIYLRLLALHKFNHRRRSNRIYLDQEIIKNKETGAEEGCKISPELFTNLKELILLLSANNGLEYEDSRSYFFLLKAETERELELWKEAEKTITLLQNLEELNTQGEAVKYLVKNKLSGVYLLPEG